MILIHKIISGLNISGREGQLDTGFSSIYSFLLFLLLFFLSKYTKYTIFHLSEVNWTTHISSLIFALVIWSITHISSFHFEHSENIMIYDYFKIDEIK